MFILIVLKNSIKTYKKIYIDHLLKIKKAINKKI